MKPFNLELAKAGHPVQTITGHKARIICFDCKSNGYPIIALITDDGEERSFYFTEEGKCLLYEKYDFDLVMAPVKKEGWINIYQCAVLGTDRESRGIYSSEREALENRIERDYIATARIEWEE